MQYRVKLFGCEVILVEFQPMSSRYLIVTDRQMDGQTKAFSIPRNALVHRAVKTMELKKLIVHFRQILTKFSILSRSYTAAQYDRLLASSCCPSVCL